MWCRHFWISSKLQENDKKPTLKINNWSSSKYLHQNMWCFNTWIWTMQFMTSWFMFSFSWLNRARRRYARDLCETVNELKQEIHDLKVVLHALMFLLRFYKVHTKFSFATQATLCHIVINNFNRWFLGDTEIIDERWCWIRKWHWTQG